MSLSVQSPAVAQVKGPLCCQVSAVQALFLRLGLTQSSWTERVLQHNFGTTYIMSDLEWQPDVYCRLFVHILVLAQMFQHILASLLALTGKKEQNQTTKHPLPVQTIISQIHVHNPKAIA